MEKKKEGGGFMGKWIFRLLAMVAIGGAVIFTARFREDGRMENGGKMKKENHLAKGTDGRNAGETKEPVREELVDLYFRALRDLIRSDFGLAEDVACFGFDFSQAGSLTEGEGKVLAERLKKKFYKSKVIFGTFEELEKAGHIKNDGGGLLWPDGLLLTLKVTEEKESRIVFSMSAWRSGQGATGRDDVMACKAKMGAKGKDGCEASEESGKWHYDKSGSIWVS